MKHALYMLTIPVLWLLQITMLVEFIIMHIVAAPFRAFIQWGGIMKRHPGWKGFCHGAEADELAFDLPKREGE